MISASPLDQHAVHDVGAVPAGMARGRNGDRPAGQRLTDLRTECPVVRMPVLVNAPMPRMSIAHLIPRGGQAWVIRSIGATCSRYSRLACLTHRRGNTPVCHGFREPDGRAQMVDVRVGQQNRPQLVRREAQFFQRRDDVVAVPRIAGVDENRAVSSTTTVQFTSGV